MWQILLLSFCNGGGPNQTEQNSSIPGGDLESHNLGRECSQSLTPPPHCLGSQWQVSVGDWPKLYSRSFHSKLWTSPPRAQSSWSFYCEGADSGCQRDHRWNFPPRCFGESVHWQTPKSTWPWTFWKPMLSVFFLSQGCRSQRLGLVISTMGTKNSTYPNNSCNVFVRGYGNESELLFTTRFWVAGRNAGFDLYNLTLYYIEIRI